MCLDFTAATTSPLFTEIHASCCGILRFLAGNGALSEEAILKAKSLLDKRRPFQVTGANAKNVKSIDLNSSVARKKRHIRMPCQPR